MILYKKKLRKNYSIDFSRYQFRNSLKFYLRINLGNSSADSLRRSVPNVIAKKLHGLVRKFVHVFHLALLQKFPKEFLHEILSGICTEIHLEDSQKKILRITPGVPQRHPPGIHP